MAENHPRSNSRRSEAGRADSRPPRGDRNRTSAESPSTPPSPEIWIDEGPAPRRQKASARKPSPRKVDRRTAQRNKAQGNKARDKSTSEGSRADLNTAHLIELVGPVRAERLAKRIRSAAGAFAGGRYEECRSVLAPIVKEAPDFVESRELYGLALYRLGRWKQAAAQLEAFVELSGGSTEQHPVLADCRRALKQYGHVERLWKDLKEASPSSELVTEGRIVAAGALADQGRLSDAVRLLSAGFRFPKRPGEHHLRRAYALADLVERSGDLPQARALFIRVAQFDPEYLDAGERADALR